MRLGTCLLNESRTLQGARAQMAYFCSATVAGFYSAVDTRAADELDLLPEGSAIAEMLADYSVMRAQVRSCRE